MFRVTAKGVDLRLDGYHERTNGGDARASARARPKDFTRRRDA
jgi:hypothetical protein